MEACKNCRYFKPLYYMVGKCCRQEYSNSQSKMFTDDNKASILVNITFGCVQWEELKPESESIL
jgi:hypothetical protein